MPTTKIEMGAVAQAGSGARVAPTMAPVANSTVIAAPENAWVTDNARAFRRARPSPMSSRGDTPSCWTGVARLFCEASHRRGGDPQTLLAKIVFICAAQSNFIENESILARQLRLRGHSRPH